MITPISERDHPFHKGRMVSLVPPKKRYLYRKIKMPRTKMFSR